MLIPPSTTQFLDEASLEFSELLKGVGLVCEEIESGLAISCDMDDSFMNPIINPVPGKIKGFSDLWHREVAGNPAGMGLAAFSHDAVFQTDGFNCTGQQVLAHG